ncbi:hypothetical protein P8452_39879 [Trifolium repens]|nr:hypothetical protein P8452_39879 [Trifolium repens]
MPLHQRKINWCLKGKASEFQLFFPLSHGFHKKEIEGVLEMPLKSDAGDRKLQTPNFPLSHGNNNKEKMLRPTSAARLIALDRVLPSLLVTFTLMKGGATHHVTNDLANLALHHPYTGPDSLFMGNGSDTPNNP